MAVGPNPRSVTFPPKALRFELDRNATVTVPVRGPEMTPGPLIRRNCPGRLKEIGIGKVVPLDSRSFGKLPLLACCCNASDASLMDAAASGAATAIVITGVAHAAAFRRVRREEVWLRFEVSSCVMGGPFRCPGVKSRSLRGS
ncbi:hypothetical protein ACFPRL_23360 [Pseudoclavibacter helvolus]